MLKNGKICYYKAMMGGNSKDMGCIGFALDIGDISTMTSVGFIACNEIKSVYNL